jgi:hypothetical protein
MRIYVAGRTTDTRTVMNIAESLEEEGHEITFKWYDESNPDAEIRISKLESSELELIEDHCDARNDVVEPESWTTTVRHIPTGEVATASGSSKVGAHDSAVNLLRGKINAGWSADPDKARELADREVAAVKECDACILVWASDILGAAMETGSAIFDGTRTFVYRPGRDCIFYWRSNVSIHWTKSDLLEAVKVYEFDEEDGFGEISLPS